MSKVQRDFFKASNKYQEKIVLLVSLPALFIFLVLVLSLLWIRKYVIWAVQSHEHINFAGALMNWLYHFSSYVVIVLCCTFVVSVIWVFSCLKNLIGPFNRINHELDAIIEGRSQKLLTARPEDEMFNELLKRVNVLVGHYIEHKNK